MSDTDKIDVHPSADVGAQRVARVYAEALLNAAAKQGKEAEILEELQSLIGDLFPADPQFEAFLASAAVSRKDKVGVLQAVFANRASELFFNFLMVLNQHERLDLLRTILAAAQELHDQRSHRIRIQVHSAAELPEDQKDRLRQELRTTFQLEPVLETKVDPDLLGGMVVRVGDWLYDGSVRTRLETIRNQLIARSSHEIQSRRDRFSSAV